ncbi:hypothetical protein CLOHIR_01459 [Peptacetobacter hiranonis DSM 13275]|uniref:Uncharacterized protein n=1 Tax=Peptacetobacter hiranonis (strain DSM 13275 / JCM 10541 / KCTC 15199 / TO-931) TaxID=500633 RepID=B6G005_PEPHT|nr:hypothetical protein CLOHIR_01459 [Peptacetobacter hiranonis DSM 13275]
MYYCFRYNKKYTIRDIFDMPAGEVKVLTYFAKMEIEEKMKEIENMK